MSVAVPIMSALGLCFTCLMCIFVYGKDSNCRQQGF